MRRYSSPFDTPLVSGVLQKAASSAVVAVALDAAAAPVLRFDGTVLLSVWAVFFVGIIREIDYPTCRRERFSLDEAACHRYFAAEALVFLISACVHGRVQCDWGKSMNVELYLSKKNVHCEN